MALGRGDLEQSPGSGQEHVYTAPLDSISSYDRTVVRSFELCHHETIDCVRFFSHDTTTADTRSTGPGKADLLLDREIGRTQ